MISELEPLRDIYEIDECCTEFLPNRREAIPDRRARPIERMTLLSGEMGQRYGFFPRMNYKLLGDQWQPGSADAIGALIART